MYLSIYGISNFLFLRIKPNDKSKSKDTVHDYQILLESNQNQDEKYVYNFMRHRLKRKRREGGRDGGRKRGTEAKKVEENRVM